MLEQGGSLSKATTTMRMTMTMIRLVILCTPLRSQPRGLKRGNGPFFQTVCVSLNTTSSEEQQC